MDTIVETPNEYWVVFNSHVQKIRNDLKLLEENPSTTNASISQLKLDSVSLQTCNIVILLLNTYNKL